MEHENDPKLDELLREWKVPDAPAELRERVLSIPARGWRYWLRGSIRVPVPVGLALVILLAVMAGLLLRRPVEAPASGQAFNLADFQPVDSVNVRVEGGGDAR